MPSSSTSRVNLSLRRVTLNPLMLTGLDRAWRHRAASFISRVTFNSVRFCADTVPYCYCLGPLGAAPTDEEQPTYEKVKNVLDRASEVLTELEEYAGAGESIRQVSPPHPASRTTMHHTITTANDGPSFCPSSSFFVLFLAVVAHRRVVVPYSLSNNNKNSQAISNPKDEGKQTTAWDAVCPLVTKLKSFYDYSYVHSGAARSSSSGPHIACTQAAPFPVSPR